MLIYKELPLLEFSLSFLFQLFCVFSQDFAPTRSTCVEEPALPAVAGAGCHVKSSFDVSV